MEPALLLDIGRESIFVLIKIATPIMLVALGVGLIISLFQALTQIQEMTLSFVPKIIAIFVSLLIFLPYMGNTLQVFAQELQQLIIGIGG